MSTKEQSPVMFDFLKKVPLFADLPDEDLESLCPRVEVVRLSPGEELFKEGSPGDRAYVIKEGELEVLKESSGRDVLLAVRHAGEVIGEMALMEESPRMASVRARSETMLYAVKKEQLDALMNTSPSAARTLFYVVLGKWRGTEAMLRQSEKMAHLGTSTAGVAHELNNPAAAVKRGADQLQDAMKRFAAAQSDCSRLALSESQQQELEDLMTRAQERAARPAELEAMARSDQEYEMETWLEDREIEDPWELAPPLVNLGFDPEALDSMAELFESDQLPMVIGMASAAYTANSLLAEIGQGSGRISDIVKALKSYSYLDQAPIQEVDVHEGLDNTLLILRNKLSAGISVRREYATDLPRIQAYGSELNQVWTNLIDNAADALEGQGLITLRTLHADSSVVVEIEDSGPGIPPDIQFRIFDSFFTTKPPGKGTGLGLDISYNIVVHKHRGDIKVLSEPGKTVFQVWLPVNFEAK